MISRLAKNKRRKCSKLWCCFPDFCQEEFSGFVGVTCDFRHGSRGGIHVRKCCFNLEFPFCVFIKNMVTIVCYFFVGCDCISVCLYRSSLKVTSVCYLR